MRSLTAACIAWRQEIGAAAAARGGQPRAACRSALAHPARHACCAPRAPAAVDGLKDDIKALEKKTIETEAALAAEQATTAGARMDGTDLLWTSLLPPAGLQCCLPARS